MMVKTTLKNLLINKEGENIFEKKVLIIKMTSLIKFLMMEKTPLKSV